MYCKRVCVEMKWMKYWLHYIQFLWGKFSEKACNEIRLHIQFYVFRCALPRLKGVRLALYGKIFKRLWNFTRFVFFFRLSETTHPVHCICMHCESKNFYHFTMWRMDDLFLKLAASTIYFATDVQSSRLVKSRRAAHTHTLSLLEYKIST